MRSFAPEPGPEEEPAPTTPACTDASEAWTCGTMFLSADTLVDVHVTDVIPDRTCAVRLKEAT